jgi:hypothetical protein
VRLRSLFAVCLLSFGIGGLGNYSAAASTYFYSMTGTLSDGGSVSSNFTIDWGTTSASLNISSFTLTDPLVSGTVSNLATQTSFGSCSGTPCAPFHLNSSLGNFLLGINIAFITPPDLDGAISLLLNTNFSEVRATTFVPVFDQTSGLFNSASVVVTLPSVVETPAPAALPLFASGLAALGLLGWWRRRKSPLPPGYALTKPPKTLWG